MNLTHFIWLRITSPRPSNWFVWRALCFLLVTFWAGAVNAQYGFLPDCSSDVVQPFYSINPGNAPDSIQSGQYKAFVFLDGQYFDTLTITVNADRSTSVTTAWNRWMNSYTAHTFILTSDGNLYNSAGATVVGSISTELASYSYTRRPCASCAFCPPPFAWYNTPITLTINGRCPDPASAPGNFTPKLHSLSVDIGLGTSTNFQGVGKLTLEIETPAANMANPALLVPAVSTKYRVISTNGAVRQILSGQVLADIVTNNPYKYDVQLYRAADAGVSTNGLYQPINSPFKIITFENPDGVTNFNRLCITAVEGIVTNQYQYAYNTNSTTYTNTWQLLYPSNLRKDILVSARNTNLTERVTLLSVCNPGNPDVLVYQEQNRYQKYTWGEVLLEQVVDPNGSRLTNSWQYYTNSAETGRYTRLKQRFQNGYWERYEYDKLGRETNRTAIFLNATNGSSSDSCRVISTSYSNAAPNITTVERLAGHEIARTYTGFYPSSNAVRAVQCQTAGASWTNGANIVTMTKRDSYSRPSTVWQADGTMTFYQRVTNANNSVTTTIAAGQPSGSGNAIAEGTKTINVVGAFGQMISNLVINVSGASDGIVLERDSYSYSSDDYAFRSPTVRHIDGTQTSGSSGCCGTPNLGNAVDKDGTMTYFTFDALQRKTSSTLNNVTVSNVFDAFGNVLGVFRMGSDGSLITNRLAAYNAAGLLVSETSALNSVTTYTNFFDDQWQFVNRTTFPDGGTRLETRFRDGQLRSVTGTAVFPVRYEYGLENDGSGLTNACTKEIKLDINGNDTSEWTKAYTDMLGRTYKTAYASASGTPFMISYFNVKGQLTNEVDPDGVSMIYLYNGKGEQTHTVLDFDRDYTIDFSGADRITFTTNDVVVDNGTDVRRSRTYVWSSIADSSNLVSTVEASVDGLRSWKTLHNNGIPVTTQLRTVYDAANGYRYVTNTGPDNSCTVAISRFGTNVSSTAFDSNGAQLGRTTYGYDAQGRQSRITDARTGTTTFTFDNADQITSTVTPAPTQTTTNYFDSMGRVWKTTLPDNTSVTNEFYPAGLLKRSYGSRALPVGYSYDAQGRIKTMTNWSGFATFSGARVTTWNYDGYRGFLSNKVYEGGIPGPTYAYTSAGRLQTRAWARGITTTYTYNNAGDAETVIYSDGTAGVTNAYDRLGRLATVTSGTTVCSYARNDAGLLLGETYSGGPLGGLSVSNVYDALLRRTTNGLWKGSLCLTQTRYTYDAASRLRSLSDGASSATYSYLANSPLVGQIGLTNDGALRMTTTKSYDMLNRLTNIVSAPTASPAVSFKYGYNSANQRTGVTNADNSRWIYTYDALGQVSSGKRYWSDGTPVAGQQFEYAFDDSGNRTSTKMGGDQYGTNLRTGSYGANGLNQCTNRAVPGYLDVLGSAANTATVTVNNRPTYRKGGYFRAELVVGNTAAAAWQGVTNLGVLNNGTSPDIIATNTGTAFVPQTPEAFAYDADGNQTNGGRWMMMWDSENRVTSFTRNGSAPPAAKTKADCDYDYRWRRTQKIESQWSGSTYVAQSTNRFVYDGCNLIAILDCTNGLVCSFTWGSDASGTMQGAGGVAGLISMNAFAGTNAGKYFYCYDGNGNVMSLVNATNGGFAAQYEYGPFGEPVRATGPLTSANPFQFSTKFHDWDTDFIYYGYRCYDRITGRWLNRDPIGERGGRNLYAFVGNDPNGDYDPLGLRSEFPKRDLNGYRARRRSALIAKLLEGGIGPGDYRKDCCQEITIIIKLPLSTAHGLDGKGLGGHTGIGIEDEFYDYGPDVNDERGLRGRRDNFLTGFPGFQWWDDPAPSYTTDDIGLTDILSLIPKLAREGNEPLDVFKIEIAVNADEANRVRDYWHDKYENLGTYSLLGDQCTTTVMNSLDRGGIFDRPILTFKPIGFLKSLKSARHTCGPNKGASIRFEHINQEEAPLKAGRL